MHVYVQKLTTTTLPRRSVAVSGGVLSHAVALSSAVSPFIPAPRTMAAPLSTGLAPPSRPTGSGGTGQLPGASTGTATPGRHQGLTRARTPQPAREGQTMTEAAP